MMLGFVWGIIAILCMTQCVRVAFARPRPPGLPNFTHPVNPAARERAMDRAWEVYDAIDAATKDKALRAELRRICRRESMCNWMGEVGLHRGETDAMGEARWQRAVDRGLLDPKHCEHHQLGDDPSLWTVNGAFGTATAYVLRHVGKCVPPTVMRDPFAAARGAVGHMQVLCRRHGACDCGGRARWWAGPGVWDERTALAKLRATERQCGDQPLWSWVTAVFEDYVVPWWVDVKGRFVGEVHPADLAW